jgi:hypothetical protein
MIKNMLFLLLLPCLCFQLAATAQEKDSIPLQFHLRFGNERLQSEKKYVSANNDTLQVSTFKCYISGIRLQYANGSSQTNKDYHLLDIENPESFKFNVGGAQSKPLRKITFNIGVDSLASVSGALSGDLDPTKGMYWAWQSGYINMKIESKSPGSKTRKNEFQFHIGGYLKPNYALRTIELTVRKPNPQIAIDLAQFFSRIKLSESNSIMIPGKKAMELADYSVAMFHIE